MNQTAIDLILLAAAALFGAASARTLLKAWRSGSIKASGDRVYHRADQPGAFWGHVAFEAVILAVALAAVVVVGLRAVSPG
ncbi:MAG: hypothetical protein K1X35_03555 [Caulobacteraceae bacterium]|nr:hypothetical protein [Caulobacteraceae bacterium]